MNSAMDYGAIVSTAWRITWRYRGLWLVGLFAGSGGTCVPSYNSTGNLPSSADSDAFGRSFGNGAGPTQTDINQALDALQQVLPVLIVLSLIAVVIWVALWVLSIACSCAVMVGGKEAAEGRPVTLGSAWSMGLRRFGSLLVLDLALLVLGLLIFGVLALFTFQSFASQPLERWLGIFAGLTGILALLGLVGSLLGIVFEYARRAVVLDHASPVDGIAQGVALTRARLGTSLLLWVIAIALGVGGVIVLIVALLVAALPSLLVSGIIGLLAGLVGGPGGVVFGIFLGVLLFVAFLVAVSALNTFLWNYWTLAYLRLTAPAPVTAPLAPVPESP